MRASATNKENMEENTMKKIFAIAVAVVMIVAVMCTPVSALDESKKELMPQLWAQPTSNWSWVQALPAGGSEINVALGDSVTCAYTDFASFQGLDTSADINFGLQIVDLTLTAEGDTSTITFTTSDIVFKAAGYDDVTVKVAGTHVVTLTPKQESWGLSANSAIFNDEITAAVKAAIGSDAASIAAYLAALTEVTMDITYNAYNDEVGASAEEAPAPAEETPAAPAEEAPAAETPAPAPAPSAPATGLALAVVPAVISLAAVAVTKRR